jgi:hypothetical protein
MKRSFRVVSSGSRYKSIPGPAITIIKPMSFEEGGRFIGCLNGCYFLKKDCAPMLHEFCYLVSHA